VETVDQNTSQRHPLLDNYQQLQQRIDNYRDLCWETVDNIFTLLVRLSKLKSQSYPMLKTLRVTQQRH
jgi:hypothetical protein